MGVHRSSQIKLERLVEAVGVGPWSRQQLLGAGWRPGDVDRALRHRQIVRVRRGLYALPDAESRAEQLAIPYDARLARLHAVVRSLGLRATASHDSAAHVHGLWTPGGRTPLIHVTVPGATERVEDGVHVHSSALPDELVEVVDGLRVTTIARTAVDLGLRGDLPSALVVADSALRTMLLASVRNGERRLRDDAVPDAAIEEARLALLAAADVARGWPGSRVVRTAGELADPRSESPYESWSRGWILAVGLPRPLVNRAVTGASGRRYFGDLLWPDRRLIGEIDGVAKYGATSSEIRRAMRGERERQADLEAAGWRLVRWVPGDSGAALVARVGRALYLGREDTPARSELGA